MPRIKLVLVFALCLGIFGSCGKKADQPSTKQQDQQEAHDHNHDHDGHDHGAIDDAGLAGMTLNAGHKWKLDDSTREVFKNMSASFMDLDHKALVGEGLKTAGSELKTHIGTMIQGCSMSGADHDQLHIFLTGYIPAVDALVANGSLEDAKVVYNYLSKVDSYFE